MNSMINELVILRHGEADFEGVSDHERPLTDRGKRQATVAGQHIVEWLSGIEASSLSKELTFFVSSARRTQETWTQVSEILKLKGTTIDVVKHTRDLYLASAEVLHHLVLEQFLSMNDHSPQNMSTQDELSSPSPSARILIIIGHNPGLSELIHMISAQRISLNPGDCYRFRSIGDQLVGWSLC